MNKFILSNEPFIMKTSRLLLNTRNVISKPINKTKNNEENTQSKDNDIKNSKDNDIKNNNVEEVDVRKEYEAEFEPSLDYNIDKYKDE